MEKQNVVVKARTIYESYGILRELASQKLNKASYALFLALNIKVVEENFAEIEAKRVELIKRYGEGDSDGNVSVADENLEQFSEEFLELMDSELTLGLYVFDGFKLDVLFSSISPEEILKIEYMVKHG